MDELCIPSKVILYGGTGQSKVVKPIIDHYGSKVIAVIDDTPELVPPFKDIPLFLGLDSFLRSDLFDLRNELGFVITIGNPNGNVRIRLHHKLVELGLVAATVIHPHSYISDEVKVGLGSQIMAGAVIMPRVSLGIQNIINTNSSVDHECAIGDGCEIGPGSTLCGEITIGTNTWICAGSTVLPQLSIGDNCLIGAGAVVINDIPDDKKVVGVPASRFL